MQAEKDRAVSASSGGTVECWIESPGHTISSCHTHTHTSTHVYSLSNVQLNTTRDQQSEPASALLSAFTRLKDDLIFTRTCTRTHRQTQTHKKYLMSAIFNPDIHKLKQACTCAPCTTHSQAAHGRMQGRITKHTQPIWFLLPVLNWKIKSPPFILYSHVSCCLTQLASAANSPV